MPARSPGCRRNKAHDNLDFLLLKSTGTKNTTPDNVSFLNGHFDCCRLPAAADDFRKPLERPDVCCQANVDLLGVEDRVNVTCISAEAANKSTLMFAPTHLYLKPGVLGAQANITRCDQVDACQIPENVHYNWSD